jgi:hypothetical protein
MKQKLPVVKGLEIYLNISNLTEAIDVTRLRGYNQSDPNFDNALLEEISSLYYYSIFYIKTRKFGPYQGLTPPDNITIDERLDMIPRNSRAKVLEEHYGKTLDIGFRYSF